MNENQKKDSKSGKIGEKMIDNMNGNISEKINRKITFNSLFKIPLFNRIISNEEINKYKNKYISL